jgi:hypothetical protein
MKINRSSVSMAQKNMPGQGGTSAILHAA